MTSVAEGLGHSGFKSCEILRDQQHAPEIGDVDVDSEDAEIPIHPQEQRARFGDGTGSIELRGPLTCAFGLFRKKLRATQERLPCD